MLEDIRTCPTFVINLDRRPDRWKAFSSQPTMKSFPHLQRFSAADGSKLDPFTDKRIGIHTRTNIVQNFRRSHYEINTLGAIGASLSHIGIWKQFLQSDAPYAVVFEDDTVVTEQDLFLVDSLIPTLPEKWDLWLLGMHRGSFQGVPITDDKAGWWKTTSFTGAHAYVISRQGAKLLLEEPFPLETHIEFYMTACVRLKNLVMVRHPKLRIKYEMEYTKEDDSDTFDSHLSCPTCYIPDNYNHVFYMIPKEKMNRYIGMGFALVGAYYLWKRYGKKLSKGI